MTGQKNAENQKMQGADAALTRRIWRKRFAARVNLFAETIIPRLLWPICILAFYVALSWLGLFQFAPFVLRVVIVFVFSFGFLASLWPLFHARMPSNAEAESRLETLNGLTHQAISVRMDRPSHETPDAMALWSAHRIRMAEKVRALDSGMPAPDLSAFDPYGLRAIPILLLFVAFFYSGATGAGGLSDAFVPPATEPEMQLALRFDAWISPPSYTGKAPIYLKVDGGADLVDIPEGSVLTVRLSGRNPDGEILFQSNDGGILLEPDEANSSEMAKNASFTLLTSGVLSADGHQWAISIVPDGAPLIAFKGKPRAAANGALELEYTMVDDYGVTAAHAEIAVAGDKNSSAEAVYPLPSFPLNIPTRASADQSALTSENITDHPLAGKMVVVTLIGEDAAGHIARSAPFEMMLPKRQFYNLLAASIAEQRQIFALDTHAMPEALDYSRAITLRPEETIPDLTQFLLIKSAQTRMDLADEKAEFRDTADYMWQIATGIEDGELSAAERRLREAQNALSKALEKGASDAEISKLMDEIRSAMQTFLSEMASRMQAPDLEQTMADQETLRQTDLENMLNQLENLARSGNRDAAQQMLSQLQRMLNNIQPPSAMARQGQQKSAMREQIDKLGELIQEQQQLMNETFSLSENLHDREEWGDPFLDPDQPLKQDEPKSLQDMTEKELREALKQLRSQQQGLSEQLQDLREKLSQLGMPETPGFNSAGEAMEGAADALGEGVGGRAVEGQGEALGALRQGAQQMMNSMMAQGQGDNGGPNAQTELGNQTERDPLGRNSGSSGLDFGNDIEVPGEITVQRARKILDAIRERLNEDALLPSEPPYLERLLEPEADRN